MAMRQSFLYQIGLTPHRPVRRGAGPPPHLRPPTPQRGRNRKQALWREAVTPDPAGLGFGPSLRAQGVLGGTGCGFLRAGGVCLHFSPTLSFPGFNSEPSFLESKHSCTHTRTPHVQAHTCALPHRRTRTHTRSIRTRGSTRSTRSLFPSFF